MGIRPDLCVCKYGVVRSVTARTIHADMVALSIAEQFGVPYRQTLRKARELISTARLPLPNIHPIRDTLRDGALYVFSGTPKVTQDMLKESGNVFALDDFVAEELRANFGNVFGRNGDFPHLVSLGIENKYLPLSPKLIELLKKGFGEYIPPFIERNRTFLMPSYQSSP